VRGAEEAKMQRRLQEKKVSVEDLGVERFRVWVPTPAGEKGER
jgi:hypothetical protein